MEEMQTYFEQGGVQIGAQRGQGRYLVVKRMLDICLSACALVVLSPVILLAMLLIVIEDPSSGPIYSHVRCGYRGRRFRMYKLRSMIPNADQMLEQLMEKNEMDGPVFKIANDPRLTRVGRFLRRTSIDELPQLVNILRGDMSIVGPRPGLVHEVEQYDAYARQRLQVTPGLTCYWQVAPNRNSLSFDQWMDLDMEYIEDRCTRVDVMIMLRTMATVLRMQGI